MLTAYALFGLVLQRYKHSKCHFNDLSCFVLFCPVLSCFVPFLSVIGLGFVAASQTKEY